jgi:hypothetical protein
MVRSPLSRVVVLSLLLAPVAAAQQAATASPNEPSSTTTCTLDDGRQVYVRYNAIPSNKEKISNGKPLTPGGQPMTLFTEAQLTLGSSLIPVGAYTVYPIPDKNHWTLVVNKNVTPGSTYDEKQDVARTAMDTAQVPDPATELQVAFAHVGQKCSIRIYYGKNAAFADFLVK